MTTRTFNYEPKLDYNRIGDITVYDDSRGRVVYCPGDIVGVEGKGFLQSLSFKMIEPHTKLYHFFLVGDYVPEEDDYEILESIGKGVAIGRLSWYSDQVFDVFRINNAFAEQIGRRAYYAASKFGRRRYDYLVYVKFIGDWLKFIIRNRRLGPLSTKDFSYARNSNLICTELVFESYLLVGVRLVEEGEVPIPAAYINAYNDGRLVLIDNYNPSQKYSRFGVPLKHLGRRFTFGKTRRFTKQNEEDYRYLRLT